MPGGLQDQLMIFGADLDPVHVILTGLENEGIDLIVDIFQGAVSDAQVADQIFDGFLAAFDEFAEAAADLLDRA